jgi:hypothetical protein
VRRTNLFRKELNMTAWLPRWFVLLWLLLSFAPGVLAAEPREAELARLVKQLGHDDFFEREAATKRLTEIGEPALAALQQAKTSDDPEVQIRAEQVITAIVAPLNDKLCVEQLRFTGHTGEVWNVSVSADGKRLLTSSIDKTLRLWDAHTGKELRVFEGHTERIVGAALSPDGKRVLSGSGDKTVRLWDADTGKVLLQMTGHTEETQSVAFGPEGHALSGGGDGTMRQWDLRTGKNTRVFTGHTSYVHPVAYSARARLAATSSRDELIHLWNLETGKEVHQLQGHIGEVDQGVCFSPDGQRLVSCNYTDNTVRLWDVTTGQELKRINVPGPLCAAFSPGGKRLVSGGYPDRTVRIWDVATGKELRNYEGHTAGVTSVAYFPDGNRIVSASQDGTARIWGAPR